MKNTKKIIALGIVVLAILIIPMAAKASESPAEIICNLTGEQIDILERKRLNSGYNYGEYAEHCGQSEEFRAEMIKQKEETILQWIKDGKISQEEGNIYIEQIKNNDGNRLGVGFNHRNNRLHNENGLEHNQNCGQYNHHGGRHHR